MIYFLTRSGTSDLAVRIAFPTNPATARTSIPACRTAALGLAFLATFLTLRLALDADVLAVVLSLLAAAPALRPRLFPSRTTFFAALATVIVRLVAMVPPS